MMSGPRPQAYSHPPQTHFGVQQPIRRNEAILALEQTRRWGRQALEGARDVEGYRYDEADEESEEDEEDEEFEEYEGVEDDEEF